MDSNLDLRMHMDKAPYVVNEVGCPASPSVEQETPACSSKNWSRIDDMGSEVVTTVPADDLAPNGARS